MSSGVNCGTGGASVIAPGGACGGASTARARPRVKLQATTSKIKLAIHKDRVRIIFEFPPLNSPLAFGNRLHPAKRANLNGIAPCPPETLEHDTYSDALKFRQRQTREDNTEIEVAHANQGAAHACGF